MVGNPSDRLGPAACRIAGWCRIANEKHTPTSFRHRACTSGDASMFTPSPASTSAEPRPVRLRFPCFATTTRATPVAGSGSAAAATIAAAVETLKVLAAPPVPQVSITTSPGLAR
jgi:hypothetical protein